MELLIYVMMALVVWAAIKKNAENYKQRKALQYHKRIYNYKGKTQAQIYSILKLEVEENIKYDGNKYQIDSFSEPLFHNDGSATYIVYLTPKN